MSTQLPTRFSNNLLYFGIVSTLFGLLATFWPGLTALTFTVMWGVFALCDGIAALLLASRAVVSRGLLIFTGVLGVLAGLLVIFRPGVGIATAGWMLGFWLVFRGILDAITAFSWPEKKQKATMFLLSVLWILAGIIIMANPGAAILGISIWVGILALIGGISSITAYFMTKKK